MAQGLLTNAQYGITIEYTEAEDDFPPHLIKVRLTNTPGREYRELCSYLNNLYTVDGWKARAQVASYQDKRGKSLDTKLIPVNANVWVPDRLVAVLVKLRYDGR